MINKLLLIGFVTLSFLIFDNAYATHIPQHSGECTGNPEPEAIMVFSAEVISKDTVRLEWDQSLCSTEFQIERQSYIGESGVGFGTIFNADRDFDLEFISRVPPNNSVFFFLDQVNENSQYDYRVLAKTVTKEAVFPNGTLQYSPIRNVNLGEGDSFVMIGDARMVISTTITPISVSYEGNTPIQNLLFDLESWVTKALSPDLVSLFISWVFAEPLVLWESSLNPQNEAQLFYISPTPEPTTEGICEYDLEVFFQNNQTNGQRIDFLVTLLDYSNIIYQDNFTSSVSNREHVRGFQVPENATTIITNYDNLYVQINAQARSTADPLDYRSIEINDIVLTIPEDTSLC